MPKKYLVRLSAQERQQLETIIRRGNAPARTQTHARILLKADCAKGRPAWTDESIAAACEVSRPTIERVRRAFVTGDLTAALHRRCPPGPSPRRKLDGAQEAQLITLACSTPPEGRERWTLALLAERLVELEVVDSIARDTVRLTLKKTNSSRG